MHGAEGMIVQDFLEFVDTEFAYLNPYTSLAVCKDNDYLLTRRCDAAMEELALEHVTYKQGWKSRSK